MGKYGKALIFIPSPYREQPSFQNNIKLQSEEPDEERNQ